MHCQFFLSSAVLLKRMVVLKNTVFCFLWDLDHRAGRRWRPLDLSTSSILLALLGEEHRVDVGEDTSRGNGDSAKELAELLVIADGELDVAGDDAVLLVVTSSVASKLKDLSSKVLKDSSEVNGGT